MSGDRPREWVLKHHLITTLNCLHSTFHATFLINCALTTNNNYHLLQLFSNSDPLDRSHPAHSLAFSALLARLARSAALTRFLAHSLTRS